MLLFRRTKCLRMWLAVGLYRLLRLGYRLLVVLLGYRRRLSDDRKCRVAGRSVDPWWGNSFGSVYALRRALLISCRLLVLDCRWRPVFLVMDLGKVLMNRCLK